MIISTKCPICVSAFTLCSHCGKPTNKEVGHYCSYCGKKYEEDKEVR